jgi:hypothetical protein
MAAPQPGQTRASTSRTRLSSAAHDIRCGRDGASLASAPVVGVGLGLPGPCTNGTRIRAGGLGSSGRNRLRLAKTP